MSETQFLLYLKALIWSVFVSYTNTTVQHLAEALNKGSISGDHPELQDTHLGICLRYFLAELQDPQERRILSEALYQVRESLPSLIYKNKVIEVGHYVITAQPLEQVPDNCYGVVHCLQEQRIHALFRCPQKHLIPAIVHPFQIMPVYTLTIPPE
ncbi:MAG: hypothetical protein ACOX5R_17200 [bacterium]|jgi:hypothetical protein